MFPPLAVCLLWWVTVNPSPADTLYETEFENFTEGADMLVGTDGWVGTNIGEGVHGIDHEIIPGLGKTGYLGFTPPRSGTSIVTVFPPLLYDPIGEGKPLVEFEALFAIRLSDNNRDDRFFVSVYNSAGQLLAAVAYYTRAATYGLWRLDGTNAPIDTGVEYIAEEPQYLYFQIDFENNRWSADLDGIPVFTAATFNANSLARDLGSIALEWRITAPASPGDNWMLFDEWFVSASPRCNPVPEPFEITSSASDSLGNFTLTWPSDPGCSYRVQTSADLGAWEDLTLAPIIADDGGGSLSYTDTQAPGSSIRFYRVVREAVD